MRYIVLQCEPNWQDTGFGGLSQNHEYKGKVRKIIYFRYSGETCLSHKNVVEYIQTYSSVFFVYDPSSWVLSKHFIIFVFTHPSDLLKT